MKTFSIDEIRKLCKDQAYKYVCLVDQNNNPIVAYNNAKIPVTTRLNEICTRLRSTTLPDGNYQVKGKSSIAKNVTADTYWHQKGNAKDIDTIILEVPTLSENGSSSPAILTYDQALKFQVQIMELTSNVNALELELENAYSKIDELEAEQEEHLNDKPNGFLADAKTFLSETIIPLGIPLLDKILDQRDRKIAIEERKLMMHRPRRQPQVEPGPAQPHIDYAREFITEFSKDLDTNPDDQKEEVVRNLVTIYNKAENLSDFEMNLSGLCVDPYYELVVQDYTQFKLNYGR